VRPHRRLSPVRGGITLGLAAVVVAVLLPVVSGGLPSILGALNPFGTDRHERSEAAVLHALDDLSEFRAARADLQVVVEIEDDTRYVPAFISGRRTTLLASGDVDAFVDLGALDGAVEVTDDGSVIVTLPTPRIAEPRLDPDRSRVLDADRGVLDRVGDMFTGNPANTGPLYSLAQDELRGAAAETDLRDRAESNTAGMVRSLLGEVGFERVEVRFEDRGADVA
jgi:hypothetical protein